MDVLECYCKDCQGLSMLAFEAELIMGSGEELNCELSKASYGIMV